MADASIDFTIEKLGMYYFKKTCYNRGEILEIILKGSAHIDAENMKLICNRGLHQIISCQYGKPNIDQIIFELLSGIEYASPPLSV